MRDHSDVYIDGAWRPARGADAIEVINPATEELYGRVRSANQEDVDAAVRAAATAQADGRWRRLSRSERCAIIADFRDALLARAADRIRETVSTLGQPITRARQFGQIPALFDMYLSAINELDLEYLRTDPSGTALITRQPVGVVAGVTPWNAPVRSEIKKLVPALLAGCSVVLKPSPETPFGVIGIVEAAERAGLPAGVLNVVFGDARVGEALVRHPSVDKVAFTGSTATGVAIGRICGERFARMQLELGGKSAAIVLPDADLETAVPWIISGNYGNAGQSCYGLTRVLIPRERLDEFESALIERTREQRVGDPFDEATTIGPLISQRQRRRVLDLIDKGHAEGARLLVGGGVPEHLTTGWFVEPTIFSDVHTGMTVAQEEIFGPVMSVLPYDDEAEAIAIANDSRYGLHGAVFSSDELHALDVARCIRTGGVGINRHAVTVHAPFGGVKNSGVGREHGVEGYDSFLEPVAYGVTNTIVQALVAAGVPHTTSLIATKDRHS